MSDQFWPASEQKFRFTPVGGTTYTLSRNPQKYASQPAPQAELQIPANIGPGFLNGGLEYAPAAIPLVWNEMDRDDYLALTNVNLQYCQMIDMEDQGFYGWLKLGSFDWIPAPTKKGGVQAIFMASGPANGLTTTINTLAAPTSVSKPITVGGGGIAAGTTVYYWLTFSSPWGETPAFAFSNTYASNGSYSVISWTAPSSAFFRRARLYASTAASGQPVYIKGDILAAQSAQFTDYNGCTGLDKVATVPTMNLAATGYWSGGVWKNAA